MSLYDHAADCELVQGYPEARCTCRERVVRSTPDQREAELGEVVHDRGAAPDTGWFILGVDGYFDVDNACWCEFQDGDAPWTSEWFDLFGTVTEQFARRVGVAERYRDVQAKP